MGKKSKAKPRLPPARPPVNEDRVNAGKESQGIPHGEKTQDHSSDESGSSEKESMQVGVGLKNDGGENNCFLNVLIQSLSQSLWLLRRFQDEFLKRTEHDHVGVPCVVCGLCDIFTEQRMASTSVGKEAVAPMTFKKNTRWGKRDKTIKVIIPKKNRLVRVRKQALASPGVTIDGDHLDSDNLQVPAVKEDPLKLQKEEFRRKTELDAEKTKLDEAPECQRINENEAKGKQLAVQQHEECGCFLKVIIQSLWHLSLFREKFLRRYTSKHFHEGDPCVVCALHDLFVEMSIASTTMHRKAKAIATTSLRVAISALARQKAISELNQQKGISELYQQKFISELDQKTNFFLEGQMSNAFEVLNIIFDCLHRAYTPNFSLSQQVQRLDLGPWDSSLFRMDVIAKMDCHECKQETQNQKYTLYLQNAHAKTLLRMKAEHTKSAFNDLLCRVLIRLKPCRNCMKRNYVYYIMSTPPRVFTTVVHWEDASDNGDDVITLLTALSTEIDLSVLFRGLDPNHKHNLVSMWALSLLRLQP